VTVWDSGAKGDGANSTSAFLSGLAKSLPPIDELLKNAGMELPSLLQGAKPAETDVPVAKEVKEKKEETKAPAKDKDTKDPAK